jgi:hypothetical protein
VFRGEKAYRIMYELRIRKVPDGFHVHHKCSNSACVNPRHLVALSPEAHRAVHATKDIVLKERIYRGEWEQIQAAEAKAALLAREKAEKDRLEREGRRQQQQVEWEHWCAERKRWRQEHPLRTFLRWDREQSFQDWALNLLAYPLGAALAYFGFWFWTKNPVVALVLLVISLVISLVAKLLLDRTSRL